MSEIPNNKFTPLVFIGIGSTASNILIRVRDFFYKRFGSIYPPGINYISIDADNDSLILPSSNLSFRENEIISFTSGQNKEKDDFKSLFFGNSLSTNRDLGLAGIPNLGSVILNNFSNDLKKFNSILYDIKIQTGNISDFKEIVRPNIICLYNASAFGGLGIAMTKPVIQSLKHTLNEFNFIPYAFAPSYLSNQSSAGYKLFELDQYIPKILNSHPGYIIDFGGSDFHLSEKNIAQNDFIDYTSKYLLAQLSSEFGSQFDDPNLWVYQNIQSEKNQRIINTDIDIVNREALSYLNKYPDKIHDLTSRNFELVIGSIWKNLGYAVEMTKETRDGGKDFYAAINDISGVELLYAVECKKYSKQNPVSVKEIRSLYGVVQAERLTAGILVTSSYFSKDAREFQLMNKHQISLKDLNDIQNWLSNIFETKVKVNAK